MKTKLIFKNGFTMIELLVAVAIIGILSAIIVTGLASQKNKSNDTKVKSQMSSLKRTMEVYGAANGNNYGTLSLSCTGPFADASADSAKFTTTSNYPTGTSIACNSNGSAWAVSASLSSGYWCVDSEGATKIRGTALSSGTTSC